MTPSNLFGHIPEELPEELLQTLFSGGKGFRVERIVSRGHSSPDGFWYEQDEAEWVLLLSGAAELEYQDPPRRLRLEPGDCVAIAPRQRHRVAWTAPERDSVWLAVFYEK
ncbi:cupin domain-containing protein [Chromobacterium sp.]|uniref:cupin domain-containing protein n=1 Tax=Chromobacterium sp. TaxID=306190 RepID=UPI0035B1C3FA